MDSPSTRMRPPRGARRRRTVLKSVVLPPPFGLRRQSTSPPDRPKVTSRPTSLWAYPKARSWRSRRIRLLPPAPRDGEQPDEERGADEGGEHTQWDLERGDGARQRVHGDEVAGAQEHRRGQEA